MKKHINTSAIYKISFAMLSMLLLMGLQSQAQTAQADPKTVTTDTTEVIVGNKVITITMDTITGKKDVQVHTRSAAMHDGDHDRNDSDSNKVRAVDVGVLGIDLGANFLMYDNKIGVPSSQSAFETEPLRSTNLALHILPTHFNMAKGKVSILTAITFDNNCYQFRNGLRPLPAQPTVTMVNDSVSLKKNKLNMWYGQIPLLLAFQTNPGNNRKNFHIALGGFAGLFLGANTKQKSDENGKVIIKDDFNLNPVRYGLTARIGFSNLELYCNYTMSSLFREAQGPTFNNINFGIALTGMM
jgi:hypothetical protein